MKKLQIIPKHNTNNDLEWYLYYGSRNIGKFKSFELAQYYMKEHQHQIYKENRP